MIIEIDLINGLAVPEGRVEVTLARFLEFYKAGEQIPPIGQAELMDGIRLMVKRGLMENIVFYDTRMNFPSSTQKVLSDGRLEHFPAGWLGDVHCNQLTELIMR